MEEEDREVRNEGAGQVTEFQVTGKPLAFPWNEMRSQKFPGGVMA